MQRFLPVVFALVIGILLGAFQPRGEVLALRAELDVVKGTGKKADCKSASTDQIRELLGADHATVTPHPVEGATPDQGAPLDRKNEPTQADLGPQSFDELSAVLDTRRAQAQAALEEQGALSPEQQKEFNRVMEEFNQNLKESLNAFASEGVKNQQLERHDFMILAADVLDSVVVAEDRLAGVLSEEQLAELDPEAVDPLSYISGESVQVLQQVWGLPAEEF